MTSATTSPSPLVVVTGANGLVGSHVCTALSERDGRVRAVVRRAGTAPRLPGVEEEVGDFTDPEFAAVVVQGADAVVTTVHPMGSDRQTQHSIGVEATSALARAARDAGVARLVHISTAAVYELSPQGGDVEESSQLVDDSAGDYAVTKRDTDAALAQVDGLTRVLIRPPAILGNAESSVWNTLRPAVMADEEQARHAIPERSFPWVHVDDLAALAADVAMARIAATTDLLRGPVTGECTPVNVAGSPATMRDYVGTVADAVGVDPVWDEGPAWTGDIDTSRARAWGWSPAVSLDQALSELSDGLSERG
ncbi:MAG: NAD(P)H-binding protein [Ornithinimicrobium sp.]